MEILTLFLLIAVIVLLLILVLRKQEKPVDNMPAIQNMSNDIEKELTVLSTRLDELSKGNIFLYQTVDKRLGEIREDNEKQLTKMRETVDEKLQSTLEARLSSSFKTVSERLESVYKQLGEVQSLARGVGNLERVLTNVKTRGMWGELQAQKILEEILLPSQYLSNVVTKKGSKDPVEFAVKLPGHDNEHSVLMPIDSKFPREDYEKLCDASQAGDSESVKVLRVSLERRILSEAKDISEKYIDVPYTTDFAVLFLPIEGLYAEVLAVPGLQQRLQRDFHIMVAGPATLASLLNSLQMGFKTLAIEKKSAEVWHVLGEVKTEFSKFGVTLERVQDKLSSATKEVESAFVRQRAMDRKLRSVEAVEISEQEEKHLIEDY